LPQPSIRKEALTEEGEAVIYLQPLPQEAEKLRFSIEAISAVRTDGSHVPLPLSLNEVKGSDRLGRQSILATGTLPPGSYTGLAVTLNKAFVQTAEGEMALLVPEKQLSAEKLFAIERQKALALFLTVNPSRIISSDIRFTPSFSLVTPSNTLINLTGYVSNSAANLISVFNKKSMQVVNAIATGQRPTGLALDQRRARAFVAISEEDAIQVFDVFNGKMIGRVRLTFGDNPVDLALTPDGETLVSANHNSNTVSIIDAISFSEIRRIRVGESPTSVTLDPSGLKAYVTNSLANTVSVVDLTQQTFSANIAVKGTPVRAAFNRAGDNLYVITRDTPNLEVIDPSRFTVIRRIFIGPGAASITVDFRTGLVLVGKRFGGGIVIVDPFTSIFVDSIGVRGEVVSMTIDRQENTLFVVLLDRRLVQKINLTSKEVIAEIEVSEGAHEVFVVGES
jgi:YVTN family beta-propeller protein